MTVPQLSIFMENKPQQLSQITEALGSAEIDIRAISIADTKDFGIVRMIVSDVEKAQRVVREKGFMSRITQVLCIELDDRPGRLNEIAQVLAEANINIDYMYACITIVGKSAYIVVRTDDAEKTDRILTDYGVNMISELNF